MHVNLVDALTPLHAAVKCFVGSMNHNSEDVIGYVMVDGHKYTSEELSDEL